MNKRTHSAGSVLFKFECLKCCKIVKINIFEVLEVGYPMCCDEEMDISMRCTLKEE